MGSALRRVATNFNVESRAHRLLDKQVPRPSPKHPSTADKIARFQEENPQVLEKVASKDDRLLGMLRDVKVVSSEVPGKRLMDEEEAAAMKKTRPLPQRRTPNPEPISVFLEADEIQPGRLSVGQALELLAKHKRNKQEFNAEVLAEEYELDSKDTENILEYFQSFKVIPIIADKDVPRFGMGQDTLPDRGTPQDADTTRVKDS